MTKTVTIPCACCGCDLHCPPCTTCAYAVIIVNDNDCTDDDFDLYLNGVFIAHIPEIDTSCTCPDPTGCRGTLVIGPGGDPGACAHAFAADRCVGWPGGLANLTVVTTAALDAPTDCTLTFNLVSTSNHHCGNQGSFTVLKLCWDEGTAPEDQCCIALFDDYLGESGAVDETYTVCNPCCPSRLPPPTPLLAPSVSNTVKPKKVTRTPKKPPERKPGCGCGQKVQKPFVTDAALLERARRYGLGK